MKTKKGVWIAGGLLIVAGVMLSGCSQHSSGQTGSGPARRYESVAEATEPATSVERATAAGRPASAGALTTAGQRGAASQVDIVTEARVDTVSVSGLLREEDEEWFLDTDEETLQLGFGPPSYRDSMGIVLSDGAPASVRGSVADDGEIEVITCETGGELYSFRTEDGVAMWSGRFQMSPADGSESVAGGRGRRASGGAAGGGGSGGGSAETGGAGGRRGRAG
jgi:hypothetical protein